MQSLGVRIIVRKIVIIIVGLGFLISGIITYVNRAELINNGSETTAIVTEIRISRARGAGTNVFVMYIVGGVVYNNRIDLQSGTTYVGDIVDILYNPNNPYNITLLQLK